MLKKVDIAKVWFKNFIKCILLLLEKSSMINLN